MKNMSTNRIICDIRLFNRLCGAFNKKMNPINFDFLLKRSPNKYLACSFVTIIDVENLLQFTVANKKKNIRYIKKCPVGFS